jgi:hypothetical protein
LRHTFSYGSRQQQINGKKNAAKSLAILIAMAMQGYDARCIARWSTSRASLETSGCRHRLSACLIARNDRERFSSNRGVSH